jgi:hypothetical protein
MERQTATKIPKPATRNHSVQRQSAAPFSAGHRVTELQRSIGNRATQRLINSPFIQAKRAPQQIQRVVEVRPPGRGEASAFDRRDELIARMNAISAATDFTLDGRVIRFAERAGGVANNFEQQMRALITRGEVLPMRLITSAGRLGGGFILVDDFDSGYVDLDDLLASDDVSFQLNLIHLLTERANTRNYARRMRTGRRFPDREFNRAHRAGLRAEETILQNQIGDPTIRFLFDRRRRDSLVFVFGSDEGYRVFHLFRHPRRAERPGEIFVETRDGRRLTIDQLRAERAAAAPAPAAPAPAPAAPVPPGAPGPELP